MTVRDWLNLTAKEGLTTYREDTFMADLDAAAAAVTAPYGSTEWEPELLSKLYSMTSAAARGLPADAPRPCSWRRVWEAAYLRQEQFDEEEGPLAHPIRPRQVSSLCALYTDTVYAKVGGAGLWGVGCDCVCGGGEGCNNCPCVCSTLAMPDIPRNRVGVSRAAPPPLPGRCFLVGLLTLGRSSGGGFHSNDGGRAGAANCTCVDALVGRADSGLQAAV